MPSEANISRWREDPASDRLNTIAIEVVEERDLACQEHEADKQAKRTEKIKQRSHIQHPVHWQNVGCR